MVTRVTMFFKRRVNTWLQEDGDLGDYFKLQGSLDGGNKNYLGVFKCEEGTAAWDSNAQLSFCSKYHQGAPEPREAA